MKENIINHNFCTSQNDRNNKNGHCSLLLWFTGLSGSGKSTLANAVERALQDINVHTYTLDGDNVRGGLNKNLTFSPLDRKENIRRIAEVSNLMLDAGLVVLGSFISPYQKDRDNVKRIVGDKNYIEIYVNTPLEECEKRDIKGLYAKARKGEIKNFTGIDAPYEAPENPDLIIDTSKITIENAVTEVVQYVIKKIDLKK